MQIAKAKASIPAEAANARKEDSTACSGLRAKKRWSNIVPPDVLFGSACSARLAQLLYGAAHNSTKLESMTAEHTRWGWVTGEANRVSVLFHPCTLSNARTGSGFRIHFLELDIQADSHDQF